MRELNEKEFVEIYDNIEDQLGFKAEEIEKYYLLDTPEHEDFDQLFGCKLKTGEYYSMVNRSSIFTTDKQEFIKFLNQKTH